MNIYAAHISSAPNEGKLLALALCGCACGVYLFYRGFQILQRKRLIENTPASKIHSAALGLVEVNGLAVGPHTINAPVTGVPCYYYRSLAWQLRRSGKNEHWEKVADESLHVPFYVDDNTGTLLVDPQGAEMDIHKDFCETYSHSLFSSSMGLPSGAAAFLSRYGVDCDQKTKVEEYCLKPKNSLFILGTLNQNHGVEVSATPVRSVFTDPPGFVPRSPLFTFHTLLADSGNPTPAVAARSQENYRGKSCAPASQEKLASTLLKAGITNPAAWAVAGVMQPNPARAPMGVSATGVGVAPALDPFDLHPATVLMKGTHNPAFYISWRSQRDIVRSMGWKSALMIWGGPAMTLLSAYVLSAYFGWF